MADDDIVISGISGRYPESNDVNEFWQNLLSGEELVTADDRRWPLAYLNLPPRQGKVKEVGKMDHEFFKVSASDANYMDPQVRLLHETTYEAIVDAGIDPTALRGTQTAVFIGLCYDDADSAFREDPSKSPAYKQLASSRLSYAFDLRGPVFATDTACASSFSAFHKAVATIRAGQAENVLVCGVAIHLRPFTAVAFHNLKMLSDDGRSKCMDASADGYCRSEAVVTVLLQKRCSAKRIYATVLNTRTNNDGYKPEGITFPSFEAQKKLMQETYTEVGVDPSKLSYMEAHMTGTPAGDPVESAAIVAVCCPEERTEPLLMGCLKSNMGHTEGASGLCAITKACLALQRRELPPNLHLTTPNPNIEGLVKGILKPVLERMPFNGDLVGVNSFGFGGCNVHAVLQANEKVLSEDENIITTPGLPRLITACGRTRDAVDHIFTYVEENPKHATRGFLALINEYSKTCPTTGMWIRGHALLDKGKITASKTNRIREKKPLWFVFSALGCQWPSMAKALMVIESFADSINKSAEIVKPLGYNLLDLVLQPDQKLENLVETFLAIVSIQIALVDLLYFLGLQPDGIVGHSVGEIAAGYADGCMDREQTILTAYHISKIAVEVSQARGAMGAVGMSWEDIEQKLPQNVFIGCNNAQDSVTISGLEQPVRDFLKQLESEGTFAREVDSCGIPFHSSLVNNTYQPITDALSKVLKNPKTRSSRWLSTSVPQERWHEEEFRVLGPTYYPNSMVSPVKFGDVFQYIPKDAVVIEVGPHAMLLSLIKRGLGPDATCVPLMRKGNNDGNLEMALSAIGTIYQNGHNPQIEKMYPRVDYPVARETASLSPLIKWDHSKDVEVTKFPEFFNVMKGEQIASFDIMDKGYAFLSGHVIDGRILFPATGYLWMIWQRLAVTAGYNNYEECPVEFFNVKFSRASILSKQGLTTFKMNIMPHDGSFSIVEGGAVCVTGHVRVPSDGSTTELENLIQPKINGALPLAPKEIYKEFRVRGYDYGPTFQGLVEASSDGCRGKIKWSGNWISFTDSMLQLAIIGKKERGLFLPTAIQYLKCDVKSFMAAVHDSKDEMGESVLEAKFDKDTNAGFCRGIVIKGLKATAAPRRQAQTATVEKYQFTPYIESSDEFLNKATKQKMSNYQHYCHLLLDLVKVPNVESLEKLEEDQEFKILTESRDSKNILLQVLYKVLKSEEETNKIDLLKKELSENREISADQLITIPLLNEKLLRPQLDVMAENATSRKVHMIEANETSLIVYENVLDILDSSGLNIDYSILHPSPTDVDTSGLRTSELKANNVATDFDADFLIYKSASSDVMAHPQQYSTKNEFDVDSFFKVAAQGLKPSAFLLVLFRSKISSLEESLLQIAAIDNPKLDSYDQVVEKVTNCGFKLIASKTDESNGCHSLLVRKPATAAAEDESEEKSEESQIKEPITIEIKIDSYEWVDELKKHLLDKEKEGEEKKEEEKKEEEVEKKEVKKSKHKVWLIAKDSPSNGIIGLVNCLRKEPNGDRVRCLFIATKNGQNGNSVLKEDIIAKDLVMNVYQNGVYGSFRHFLVEKLEETDEIEHAYVDVETKGDLSSLKWYEVDHKFWPSLPENSEYRNALQVLVSAYYTAINFKDVMVATGRIPMDAYPSDYMGTGLIGMEFSGVNHFGKRCMGYTMSKGLGTTILISDPHFLWDFPESWTMAEAATVPVCYLTVYYALLVRAQMRNGESILIHAGSGGVGQAAIHVCLARGCKVFTTVGSEAKRDFIKKTFPQLTDDQIGNSRDTSFEDMIMMQTNGRGVDIVLNSLADDKFKASVRCLAEFGRFIEIGKYDIIQNHPLDLSEITRNRTFNVVCVAHLDYEAVIIQSPNAIRISHKIRDYVNEGIRIGEVKPLATHVFEKDQIEEAFRFMATGKHMGKVVIKIRDGEGLDGLPKETLTVPAIRQTYFNPTKSYIVTGGLGGFGLELCSWLVQRGVRRLVISSRSGVKSSFQHCAIKRFKENGGHIIVSNHDVSTLEGATALVQEAATLGTIGGIFHLAMVLKDAILENQTPETFAEACASKVQGTINLDKISRQSCPDLEYFVCFSSVTAGRGNAGQTNYGFANSVMERTCEVRKRDGLPALAIQWGAIGDVGVVAESMGGNDIIIGGTLPQRIPSCVEVLDKFLQSKTIVTCSSIVKADKKRSVGGGKGDLVRQICHILGVKDHTKLDPNTTLGDLGLDSLMAVEIRQALERDYDMVLSAQEVRQLKIKDIQAIDSNQSKSKDKGDGEGNSSEESSAEQVLMSFNLPVTPFTVLSEGQQGQKPIFFVPPIEGNFQSLIPMVPHIVRQVVGLNWTPEVDKMSSIHDIAKYYADKIRESYPDTQFDLLGYSFGSILALEIALHLQDQRMLTKVLFLDGSPAYCRELNKLMSKHRNNVQNDAAHVDSLITFASHHVAGFDGHSEELRTQLASLGSREERIVMTAEALSKISGATISPIALSGAAERFFKKMDLVDKFEPFAKYNGASTLMRATIPGYSSTMTVEVSHDYGLSQYINGTLDVMTYGGDHKNFISSHLEEISTQVDMYFQYLTFA